MRSIYFWYINKKKLNPLTSNRLNNRYFVQSFTFSETGPFINAKSRFGKHEETCQREKSPHVCPINGPFRASWHRLGSTWALAAGCRVASPTKLSTWTARPRAEAVYHDLLASSGCSSLLSVRPVIVKSHLSSSPCLARKRGTPHQQQKLTLEMLMAVLFNSAELACFFLFLPWLTMITRNKIQRMILQQ